MINKLTPRSAALGGFLAGILLVTAIWIIVGHRNYENYRMMPFNNNYCCNNKFFVNE